MNTSLCSNDVVCDDNKNLLVELHSTNQIYPGFSALHDRVDAGESSEER